MAKQYAPFLLKTLTDSLAAMLLLFPFYYVTDSLPPITSLLVLCICTGVAFGYFLGNPAFTDKKMLIVAVIFICFGLGLIFSHPFFLLLFTFLFLLRKGFVYSEEGTTPLNGVQALFVTFLAIALFVHALIIDYRGSSIILYIYLFYLLSFSLQMFIAGWGESKLPIKEKMQFIYMTVVTIGVAGVIALFSPYLIPLLRQIFVVIILVPLWLLSWAFFPILNWLFNLDLQLPDLRGLSGENNLSNDIRDQSTKSKIETIEIPTEMIAFLLISLVVVACIVIAYRGKIVHLVTRKRDVAEVSYGSLNAHTLFKKWNFSNQPSQLVRRQVWSLEKYAVKKGMDRDWDETLAEWFERLQISKEDSQRYIDLYNACRYGEKDIKAADVRWFSQHSRFIHDEIKKASVREKRKRKKN